MTHRKRWEAGFLFLYAARSAQPGPTWVRPVAKPLSYRKLSTHDSVLRATHKTILTTTYMRELNSILYFWSVWGRFPAKVGPGTGANGSGLKNTTYINES